MMKYWEYDDGTVAKINDDLTVSVNDITDGKFRISGFKNEQEIHDFLTWGDFTLGNENDFFAIGKSKTKLKWVAE